jgi:hypothetical protein
MRRPCSTSPTLAAATAKPCVCRGRRAGLPSPLGAERGIMGDDVQYTPDEQMHPADGDGLSRDDWPRRHANRFLTQASADGGAWRRASN